MSEKAVCQLCGEPMPKGEEMFNFHGYSGPCHKPPLQPTTNCHFCGKQYTPDQNHPEHLCWDHLASLAMSVADSQIGKQKAFVAGAQACREMMARFVASQDESTAASIRANWNPSWGPDPGKLEGDIPKIEAVQG